MISRAIEGGKLVIRENDREVLWIDEKRTGDGMRVTLGGQITASVMDDFEDEMLAILSLRIPIEVDMSEVDHISGGALNVFLFVQKEIDRTSQGSLTIISPSSPVLRVFDENGFSDLLDIS